MAGISLEFALLIISVDLIVELFDILWGERTNMGMSPVSGEDIGRF